MSEETREDRLRAALHRIAYLRPAGDVAFAKNTRELVRRMEVIAIQALENNDPDKSLIS